MFQELFFTKFEEITKFVLIQKNIFIYILYLIPNQNSRKVKLKLNLRIFQLIQLIFKEEVKRLFEIDGK